ncbi:MAG: hypothetical protein ABIN18_10170 [Pseudomonadota bacterium]
MEKEWICPNRCKMEYVSVETKELSESDKGYCALDDLEGVNVDYYGGGDISSITILRCPVCNQVIAAKTEGGL